MNHPHLPPPKPYGPTPSSSPTPITTTTNPKPAENCDNCAAAAAARPLFLHHVRLRRTYRRLCTSCVLLLHPSSFCPVCFSIHAAAVTDREPGELLRCSNCSSLTHSRCAPSHPLPPFPFLCPPCSDPTFSFFSPPPDLSIDAKMATALLCAAEIASASIAEALRAAEEEADRKVKEVAVCKKNVREALLRIRVVAAERRKAVAPYVRPESGKFLKPKTTNA